MNQELQVIMWTAGILAIIFAGGLYFWAKNPVTPKPTMFEVRDETEAEILTEVADRAEEQAKQREKENEPHCQVHKLKEK